MQVAYEYPVFHVERLIFECNYNSYRAFLSESQKSPLGDQEQMAQEADAQGRAVIHAMNVAGFGLDALMPSIAQWLANLFCHHHNRPIEDKVDAFEPEGVKIFKIAKNGKIAVTVSRDLPSGNKLKIWDLIADSLEPAIVVELEPDGPYARKIKHVAIHDNRVAITYHCDCKDKSTRIMILWLARLKADGKLKIFHKTDLNVPDFHPCRLTFNNSGKALALSTHKYFSQQELEIPVVLSLPDGLMSNKILPQATTFRFIKSLLFNPDDTLLIASYHYQLLNIMSQQRVKLSAHQSRTTTVGGGGIALWRASQGYEYCMPVALISLINEFFPVSIKNITALAFCPKGNLYVAAQGMVAVISDRNLHYATTVGFDGRTGHGSYMLEIPLSQENKGPQLPGQLLYY